MLTRYCLFVVAEKDLRRKEFVDIHGSLRCGEAFMLDLVTALWRDSGWYCGWYCPSRWSQLASHCSSSAQSSVSHKRFSPWSILSSYLLRCPISQNFRNNTDFSDHFDLLLVLQSDFQNCHLFCLFMLKTSKEPVSLCRCSYQKVSITDFPIGKTLISFFSSKQLREFPI